MSIDWAKNKTAGFDSWKSSKDMQAGQALKVFLWKVQFHFSARIYTTGLAFRWNPTPNNRSTLMDFNLSQ